MTAAGFAAALALFAAASAVAAVLAGALLAFGSSCDPEEHRHER